MKKQTDPRDWEAFTKQDIVDAQNFVSTLSVVIPRQNGTPSQVEALKKSIERGKGL